MLQFAGQDFDEIAVVDAAGQNARRFLLRSQTRGAFEYARTLY